MLNQQLSIYLNSFLFKSNFFDYFIYFFAQILPFILFVFIAWYFFFSKKEPITFVLISFIIAVSLGFSEILKFIFSNDRPFLAIPEIVPLFTLGGADSFPSGHALVLAALATAMYFENRTLGYFFFICSVAIGISRVFAGVHYAGDILAGFFIGSLFVLLGYKFIGKLRNKS